MGEKYRFKKEQEKQGDPDEPKVLEIKEKSKSSAEKIERLKKRKKSFMNDIIFYFKEGFLKRERGIREWRNYNKEGNLLSRGKKILELFKSEDVVLFYGDDFEKDKNDVEYYIECLESSEDGIKILEYSDGSEE